MQVDYIIVQAGGKGTRLEYLTANKPKALVPVYNLPLIFHLFRKYPDKRFIIIGDYKKEVLRAYLDCFAQVQYYFVEAAGSGTCGGVNQALELVPDKQPFMLVWSDLLLPEDFSIPSDGGNYIGISETFPCRWMYKDGEYEEERSYQYGIAGLFIFAEKNYLQDFPDSGEIVCWLKEKQFKLKQLGLAGTKEFGILTEYEALEKDRCRPFNKITARGDTLIKEAVDEQGEKLACLEERWYKYASNKGVGNIPAIYSYNPIHMERIDGKNIYEYSGLSAEKKRVILRDIVSALKKLHNIERVPADILSIKEAYFNKTMSRLNKIRGLVPLADRKAIIINGRECRNVYFYERDFERRLDEIKCGYFTFIHGDCTFSNLMLKNDTEPVFIDPRGYFGHTELFGDPNYDWAKMYYSIIGNYDRFNLKDFRLNIGSDSVELTIKSNGWEDTEQDFFELIGADNKIVKLLHAVIWLSLTTYAWQDFDSICGAFYNGLYYLEDVL